MNLVSYILLPPLLIAACTDIKDRTIPIWLFPSTLIAYIICCVFTGQPMGYTNIIGFIVMGTASLTGCVAGFMGGGDVIMLAVIGYIFGINKIIPFTVLMMLTGFIVFAVKKFKDVEIPVAPLVLIAFIVYLVLGQVVTK